MVHIRFGDDADELPDADQPSSSTAEAQPHRLGQVGHASTQNTVFPHCCNSIRVDFNTSNPSYVFKALFNPANQATIASTSNNIVKTYSYTNAQLTHVGDLQGHTSTINDIAFTEPEGSPTLVHSCSSDGFIKGWDLRTGQQSEQFKSNQELFSFATLENVLAAGGQGEVMYWDRRSPNKALATLSDTHMEDVTQVKFHPSRHVISASTDGLIAVHNVSQTFAEEDENFVAALNVGTSVEEVGLYGQQGEKLWVRTGNESLHLWEWTVAMNDNAEGGHGAFAEWPEARTSAAEVAAGTQAASLFEEVGYLVGCHYDRATNRIMLVAGTEGNLAFLPLSEQPSSTPGVSLAGAMMQPPVMVLQGVHSEVVRSVQCFGSGTQGPFCITGGEDSQILLWSMDPATASTAVTGISAANAMASKRSGGGQPMDTSRPRQSGGQAGTGPERHHTRFVGKQFRKQAPY